MRQRTRLRSDVVGLREGVQNRRRLDGRRRDAQQATVQQTDQRNGIACIQCCLDSIWLRGVDPKAVNGVELRPFVGGLAGAQLRRV